MDRFILDFPTLVSWCERRQLVHTADAGGGLVTVDYRILERDAPLYLLLSGEQGMLTLAVRAPVAVPAARRTEVLLLLSELNCQVALGAFTLGDQGDVVFRATIPTREVHYCDASLFHVARLVVSTAAAMTERIAAAAGVCGTDTSCADAQPLSA